MVLVDTSVWIHHLNGKETAQTRALERLIKNHRDVCVTGIVLTEILSGIGNDREYRECRERFERLIRLPLTEKAYFAASTIYRTARKSGETVRRVMDCLIAACAIEHSVALLHQNKDFDVIARHSRLKIFQI